MKKIVLTAAKRKRLHSYIQEVGAEKKSVLLQCLPDIKDDSELIACALFAGCFDGRSPEEHLAFLKFSVGIQPAHLLSVLEAVYQHTTNFLIKKDLPLTGPMPPVKPFASN
jgi:hypothetical protein